MVVADSEQDDDGGDEGEDVGRDDDGAPRDQVVRRPILAIVLVADSKAEHDPTDDQLEQTLAAGRLWLFLLRVVHCVVVNPLHSLALASLEYSQVGAPSSKLAIGRERVETGLTSGQCNWHRYKLYQRVSKLKLSSMLQLACLNHLKVDAPLPQIADRGNDETTLATADSHR